MINKYTLSFKDQSLELKYQEFQMQQKRKPLLQKLIFILLIVIIAKSIILIINFEMLALYYTIGYLILFSILTFILKFKPQLIRWVLISLNYIILAIYAQTVDGLNQYQYQLQSALIVSSQFIVINTGEFIDALVQVICIFSFYLAFYMLNEPNYSLSIVVSTFFFQVMLIITFYENVSAERSKFKLTIIDDKWDQILENMMVEPCIIFNFNFIKTSFVLKKSIDFIYSIDTTEQLKLFLRNSKVKQNQSQNINLEDFIFQKVQQLNKDNIQQWNKQLTIEYNKKVHEIYYSILSETSPIIVLKIKQYKFANNEKDQILENKYQYKYKILLKSILLQLKIIGQYKNLHLTQIFKILIYHDLLERIEKEFLVSIKIEKIVKLLKYIYPQKQIIIENCYQRQPIWVLKDSLQLILMEIFETILSKQIHIKITNFGFSRLLFVYGIFNQNSKDKLQQRLQQYKRSMEIIEISDLGVSLVLKSEQQSIDCELK